MNLSFCDILQAKNRISDQIIRTPILTSKILNEKLEAEIYFKCENLQRTGSFKFRGALNKILKFKEESGHFPKKIVAVSSGNHANAIAYLANKFGIEALIFMDNRVSEYKVDFAKKYGADVRLVESRSAADEGAAKKEREGYFFIHPSNDEDVICGQGTVCLEAIEEIGGFDAIFASCGGGGLVAGSYIAAQKLDKKPKVFAVEPALANDGAISFRTGKIHHLDKPSESVADGIRTPHLSVKAFPYFQKLDGVLEISEDDILKWTQIASLRLKVLIEPSAGIALSGAVQFLQNNQFTQKPKILVILSGGNMSAKTAKMIWEKDYLSEI
ncbi:MAG: threonine dehydratase [Rickettsiales bacterium]|jgi:threonine dehydratase